MFMCAKKDDEDCMTGVWKKVVMNFSSNFKIRKTQYDTSIDIEKVLRKSISSRNKVPNFN